MRIFISWSGERSHKIAELFKDWIQCVIQAAKPWISSHDIELGALWYTEISKTLADSQFGILCLTPENKTEPWILFEAGALAKGIEENRVCTLLIDLRNTDIDNPLAQFNHTIACDKESMWELVQTINNALLENKLQEKVLKSVFETYWEQFLEKYKDISQRFKPEEHVKKRSNEELLSEILTTVRAIDRRFQIDYVANFSRISDNPNENYWSPSDIMKYNSLLLYNKILKDFEYSKNDNKSSNEIAKQEKIKNRKQ